MKNIGMKEYVADTDIVKKKQFLVVVGVCDNFGVGMMNYVAAYDILNETYQRKLSVS